MTEYQLLQVANVEGVTVVHFREPRLSGILELEKLGQELDHLLEHEHCTRLALDFTAVEFLSSQTLGKMVSLNRTLKARHGTLQLRNVPPRVLDVLLTCKMDSIFDIQPADASPRAPV